MNGLEKGRYILLSAHREENIDTDCNFIQLFTAVNAMAETYNMPILYSCHPRSRKRLEATGFPLDRRVIAHEPLGFHDYNCLQMNAFAVVSDSGTLPEESSFFLSAGSPFPAVSIRTSTERPEALDAGCFVLAGIDADSLLRAVDMAVSTQAEGRFGTPVTDYTGENCIRYLCLSTSSVLSAIGMISETLSGGVQMIACRPILRSRRTLSMMRSLSILLNASSNTTRRTVLPKLDVSLTRYSCANDARTAI